MLLLMMGHAAYISARESVAGSWLPGDVVVDDGARGVVDGKLFSVMKIITLNWG